MASHAKLTQLEAQFRSGNQNSDLKGKLSWLIQNIQSLVWILTAPRGEFAVEWISQKQSDLNIYLDDLSDIFRTTKFQVLKRALEELSNWQEDREKWWSREADDLIKKRGVSPDDFENLARSTATVMDETNTVVVPLCIIRERVLLSIYGISFEDIWIAFSRRQ
jgi:hypothetical protein